ncbi:uncharacterized protein DUF955 [Curtobacterium sp. PhB142]|uniref:ImmA/IrrE family metallo-endopeptidase n=1 Tax=unclassified Curtobacterium TaxID=257496 RepID=UPI000DAA8F7D|nr:MULTISPECIES: ImmA/IrrE family metallo-endopeptidase [unclassified Curtobacterium]PZE86604.1 XRE family transcriptional regulator [Curtobacterium sp. MCLR17_039]TCL88770.1 uncharacterized protein DUF955 [Curtobacterium sp. PhB142]TCM03867.1 uncharacterized protein DUF955 [Curtobacterium sp. PhB134]WIE57961.1 ImmA/IrrE family metallo-endopeptidase [Curtobacterium sp. MCLR17_031]
MVQSADELSYTGIRQYAERIAQVHNVVNEDGSTDVLRLVGELGGRVTYNEDDREGLIVTGPGNFEIRLSPFTSSWRDKFTMAHELGHYFLHYRLPGLDAEERFARGARNHRETQANVFAASLLMPRDTFVEAWTELGGSERRLADRFGVSPAAARVQAEVLRLQ